MNNPISLFPIRTIGGAAAPPENLAELDALRAHSTRHPHSALGLHVSRVGGVSGFSVRAFHPDAVNCSVVLGSRTIPMVNRGGGVFDAWVGDGQPSPDYRLRFEFEGGQFGSGVTRMPSDRRLESWIFT